MAIRSLLLAVLLFAATTQSAHAQSKSDETCLALTAFTEARDQGEHGMAIVAHTVMERAKSRNTTICRAAYAPNQYHGVLFWPKGRDPGRVNAPVWASALKVTQKVMRGEWDFGRCTGAQYFYAPKVVRRVPKWAHRLPFLCEYRGHRFYGTR